MADGEDSGVGEGLVSLKRTGSGEGEGDGEVEPQAPNAAMMAWKAHKHRR